MKFLKKNQIIIYTLALMLVTAGYLNYTNNVKEQSIETSNAENVEEDIFDDNNTKKSDENGNQEENKVADIGDATLVSSNDVVEENTTNALVENDDITNNSLVAETANTQTNSEETEKRDYFIKSKLERDTMYSQMLESYEKVLNSSNSLEEQKQSAAEEINKINQTKNSIMICENLIKTKGFENCVIFINGDSVSIIIGAEELEKDQIAQIQNIISRELNTEIENIHISTQ